MWWLFLLLASPTLGFFNQEPPLPPSARTGDYSEHWVDVRLNHFDASNTDTFPMRFYYNRATPSSDNIVIFVGGEWPISPGWVTNGLALDLAEIVGGGLFYTEHRYYGLTRPSNDTSLSDLRFLTVDQALADLAQVINYIKSNEFESGRYSNAKVALVGCSYAGTMATWMRLSYPHLIDAAFSDSGPLHAKEEFTQYLEVVGDAIRAQGGQNCYNSIQQAILEVNNLLGQSNGPFQVSQLFGTCTTISALLMDRTLFNWVGLLTPFALLAQNALPGQINTACQALTNTSVSTNPMQRLAAWVRSRPSSQPCIETRYTEMVNLYRNTSWDSPAVTSRLWFYQTCSEYGWYQTTGGGRHPFGTAISLFYFHQMCNDFFSAAQNRDRLQYGIDRTNHFFGSLNVSDRTVTVQGLFDPWHPMGPDATHSTFLTPVYMVPDISHCRIIHSVNNSETPAVRSVKLQVLNDMNRFMDGVPFAGAGRAVSSVALLLGVLLAFM